MADRPTAGSIDDYIAGFPPEVRAMLQQMRSVIGAAAPQAVETISYAIPTFDIGGHHLVHFAGFKNHIGFYPIPSAMEAFEEELKPFKSGKGSARFPLDQPLPIGLIQRIVEFRVEETTREAPR